MANFRPLQPAPMDQEQPSQHQMRPLLTQKPKRTVTLGACIACRKRKSKCDGNRPICTCCTQKDTECVYELGPNEKPSQAMKRKNEEMQGELSNLRQLYDFLRLRPEQDALEILRRIRSHVPDTTPTQRIQELADFVRHGDLLIQPAISLSAQHRSNSGNSITLPPLRMAVDYPNSSPYGLSHNLSMPSIFSLASEGPTPQRRRYSPDADVSVRSDSQPSLLRPTSIGAIIHEPHSPTIPPLSDPRLASVKNWTTVTQDSNLLINIMTVWHTWEYKYFHFLDWDIFLDDLANSRDDFCSKLLVNSILASGSFQSPMVRERSKPFADNSTTLFYKEARRLWELEEGRDNLPKLQAALCLFMVLGKHGRDKVGHGFLVEACRIGREIGLFRVSPATSVQKSPGIPWAKWDRCRASTAWALFNFQLSMSFTYSFSPIIKSQPPLQIPYDDETEALFRHECGRNVIVMDCANILVDPDDMHSEIPPKPEQIEILYFRLKTWWDSRPEILDPEKHPSPENLLAAMQYHVSVIRLFQPFLDPTSSLERVKTYHSRSRSIFLISTKQLRQLLALHEVHHGWTNAISYVLHAIMVTGFGSLDEIGLEEHTEASLKQSEPYQGLLTCFHALETLSSYVFYAQPLFRLLAQACETLNISLPLEVTHPMGYYKSEEWTKQAASIVSSRYVADIRKTSSDAENLRMDTVVGQWDTMTLGDSRDSSSVSTSDCGMHEAA